MPEKHSGVQCLLGQGQGWKAGGRHLWEVRQCHLRTEVPWEPPSARLWGLTLEYALYDPVTGYGQLINSVVGESSDTKGGGRKGKKPSGGSGLWVVYRFKTPIRPFEKVTSC